MTQIRDLDLLLGKPIKARLAGVTYTFPADCPAELYLELIRSSQIDPAAVADGDELAVTQSLRDGILGLFQVFQPEMDRLPAAVSLPVMVGLVGRLYSPEPDPTPPPARRGRAGTTKPTRRPAPKAPKTARPGPSTKS